MEEYQELEYKGKVIPYTLVKSKIKNLYIYIKQGKVTVKVPYLLSKKRQQEFVNQKALENYSLYGKEKNIDYCKRRLSFNCLIFFFYFKNIC